MKTRSTRSLRRLLFKIKFFSDYAEQIGQIEKALARKPEKIQLDIVGAGELAPDTALLLRSVLMNRSPRTHLITNARSSLQGGAVLIWLLGDTRLIREDAKLHFRRPTDQDEDEDKEAWKCDEADDSEVDMEEIDYAQVLQHIDNYLPVKELAGRPLDREVLRQFGLVDSEKADQFLASAFAKSESSPESSQPQPVMEENQSPPKVARSDEPERNE
ncbi:MAG TPA: hypothetical protein VEC99_17670 [Clostridia bacterium]|nr:hypothetical protein [Clostridia bacterium]